ncbi:MAG: helix-turn-helix transcriptional regulator [Lachnospiraceae bacterium]|nr:helix-turn-helix transcriptional regulator [Lachnospiraceae bacterium]
MRYPTINMKATGIRLGQIMKWKKISPKAVQDYLGLSCVQSVYRWLNGCSIPSVDHLYALSELFQIPMDHLIVGNRTAQMPVDQKAFYTRMSVYYNAVRKLHAA